MWRHVLIFLLLPFLTAVSPAWADPAMTFRLFQEDRPGCASDCARWISAEGEIKAGTAKAFTTFLNRQGNDLPPLVINSPGGSIDDALAMGKLIRIRKMQVIVGQTVPGRCSGKAGCKAEPRPGRIVTRQAFCNSACPIVLAGGVLRIVPDDASVGVHQPKTVWTRERLLYRERYKLENGKKIILSRTLISRKKGKTSVTYGLDARLKKKLAVYYASMGIDQAILAESSKARFSSINFLSPAELDQMQLRSSNSLPLAMR